MHQGLLLYFLCVISLIDAFTVKRLLRLRPVIRSIEVQKEGTALINNDPINEDMISSLINSCALQTAGTEENEILRVSSALGRKLLSQLKQPHRKDEAWR